MAREGESVRWHDKNGVSVTDMRARVHAQLKRRGRTVRITVLRAAAFMNEARLSLSLSLLLAPSASHRSVSDSGWKEWRGYFIKAKRENGVSSCRESYSLARLRGYYYRPRSLRPSLPRRYALRTLKNNKQFVLGRQHRSYAHASSIRDVGRIRTHRSSLGSIA